MNQVNIGLGIAAILLYSQFAGAAGTCQEGVWSLSSESMQPDRTRVSYPASSTRYCFLFAGEVELDEFRLLDANGSTVFRGASFRYPHADREHVLWLMLGDPGHTLIEGHYRDGLLNSEGQGVDASGTFSERSTTSTTSDGSFVFKMDRNFQTRDGWIDNINVIHGERQANEPPALPGALDNPHKAARAPGVWHHAGRVAIKGGFVPRHRVERRTPILDGNAMVAEIVEYDDKNRVLDRQIVFESSVVDGWRAVTWNPQANTVSSHTHGLHGRADPGTPGQAKSRLTLEREGLAVHRKDTVDEVLMAEWWLHQSQHGREFEHRQIDEGCGDFGFVLGEYRIDAQTLDDQQNVNPGSGFVSAYRIMDGLAIAAEMHVLFADGSGFRGTTLRTRHSEGQWLVTWIPANAPAAQGGHTVPGDAGCVEHHRGEDQHGPFTQALRLLPRDDSGFDVVMDRQYPNGGPLIEQVWAYQARRLPGAH